MMLTLVGLVVTSSGSVMSNFTIAILRWKVSASGSVALGS